jgi:hypothetical protein
LVSIHGCDLVYEETADHDVPELGSQTTTYSLYQGLGFSALSLSFSASAAEALGLPGGKISSTGESRAPKSSAKVSATLPKSGLGQVLAYEEVLVPSWLDDFANADFSLGSVSTFTEFMKSFAFEKTWKPRADVFFGILALEGVYLTEVRRL